MKRGNKDGSNKIAREIIKRDYPSVEWNEEDEEDEGK